MNLSHRAVAISLLVLFGRPPSRMNAFLATICDGGQAIIWIHKKQYNKIYYKVIVGENC